MAELPAKCGGNLEAQQNLESRRSEADGLHVVSVDKLRWDHPNSSGSWAKLYKWMQLNWLADSMWPLIRRNDSLLTMSAYGSGLWDWYRIQKSQQASASNRHNHSPDTPTDSFSRRLEDLEDEVRQLRSSISNFPLLDSPISVEASSSNRHRGGTALSGSDASQSAATFFQDGSAPSPNREKDYQRLSQEIVSTTTPRLLDHLRLDSAQIDSLFDMSVASNA